MVQTKAERDKRPTSVELFERVANCYVVLHYTYQETSAACIYIRVAVDAKPRRGRWKYVM